MDKKGIFKLEQVPGAVIILLFIGLVLGVGGLILSNFQTTTQTTYDTSVANETHTNATTTYLTYNVGTNIPGYSLSSIFVTNHSGGTVVANANFTLNTNGSLDHIANFVEVAQTNKFNVSYTYKAYVQSASWNSTNQATSGLNTISSFQSIFAIVVAAAVILGIIFLVER